MSAVKLGSNITSLMAQRRLAEGTNSLLHTFERLSSGQRINRASDDAAGLAIADSLRVSSRIFNQSVRNLNDGISLLNIADSAIENLSSIVVRLEELAEQAANGIYGAQQRKSLDAEAQALSKEYFRISKTTTFNGIGLLGGTFGQVNLQAGFGDNSVLSGGVGGTIGTGSFAAGGSYLTGNRPSSVSTGDFNGDGLLDLVTADFASDTTSVLLGLGNGSFAPRVSFTAGTSPYSVATGDFNGDGVLDLVTADYDSDTTSVLLGRGDGTFAPSISYATGNAPVSVSTGDFNGDGILDLVTADQVSDTASVLLGLGDGTFAPRVSYATGNAPGSVSTGDFNGDGILDLVTADQVSDTASVLLGLGDGTFAPRISYATGNNPYSVSTGDFNGDGVLDLVTADYFSNGASVLFGQSTDGVAPLLSFSLETLADARQALPVFKRKRDQLAAQRGEIGAYQRRVSVASNVLQVTSENFKAAESRIRDADLAKESADLVRLNLLQQASSSVLSQANQQPQIAINLLQN